MSGSCREVPLRGNWLRGLGGGGSVPCKLCRGARAGWREGGRAGGCIELHARTDPRQV